MGVVRSPKTYLALAAFHAFDAVLCAIPVPELGELLDGIDVPQRLGKMPMGWVLAGVKTAAAAGLAAVLRFPGLARLIAAMLTVYFAIAVTLHTRTRDRATLITRGAHVAAVALLALCAAMAVTGPKSAARARS